MHNDLDPEAGKINWGGNLRNSWTTGHKEYSAFSRTPRRARKWHPPRDCGEQVAHWKVYEMWQGCLNQSLDWFWSLFIFAQAMKGLPGSCSESTRVLDMKLSAILLLLPPPGVHSRTNWMWPGLRLFTSDSKIFSHMIPKSDRWSVLEEALCLQSPLWCEISFPRSAMYLCLMRSPYASSSVTWLKTVPQFDAEQWYRLVLSLCIPQYTVSG